MIHLPTSTLEILGQRIALANNESFVRRKLGESPTIQHLADSESEEVLQEDLKRILDQEQLTEDDQTRAYAILIALLLKSPVHASTLTKVRGIDRLFWARRLLSSRERSVTATEAQLFQPPVVERPVS